MYKKIILISVHNWCLKYLKESFSNELKKKTFLITNKYTKEIKEYCKKNSIKYSVVKKLKITSFKNHNLKNSLVLSAGSPWIFEKKLIKKIGPNLVNVHQSPLPSMKGSVASYIILYEIRAFQSCIHKVSSAIDSGNIIYRKNYIIPSFLKTPFEVNEFLQKKNREMVKEFLIKTDKSKKILEEKQNSFFSSYNKRLNSETNGWINWSIDVDDLDRFIRAFDEPYNGAQTFIGNTKVQIKNIEKSKNDCARHPEEVGKVIRKFEDYVIVSVNGGSIYIKKIFKNGKNIINKIKSGDKFHTKYKYLDLKNSRVLFVKKNLIYNKNIKLKKI